MTRIRNVFRPHVVGTAAMCSIVAASLLAFDGADQQPRPSAPATAAASASPERITVPFTDPARPGRLTVGLMTGNIHVRGYQGQAVIVETRTEEDRDRDSDNRGGRGGLRRIPNSASGLTIEEDRNEMRISAQIHRDVNLDIQVPRNTSLKLSLTNGDDIVVENVDGDMEVNNTNGDITLTGVGGTAILHSVNGEVKASFTRVSDKPMSFVTLNGDVDVTLPASTKATVRLDSGQGDVYTDFSVDMLPTSSQQTVEDNRSKGGKFRIKVEKAMVGRINGGGPDYTFKTFNGDIHLRRSSDAK